MIQRYSITSVVTVVLLFASLGAFARNDVLVIVNDNSVDSPQVGAYYAQQRGIDAASIVHVRTPVQYYINWTEFKSLRDQILRFGICPSVDPAKRPAACGDTSVPIYTAATVSALTAVTPIRYIVTTRGIPTRMTVDGSTLYSAGESTSLDNYLKFWLARYLTADIAFGNFSTPYAGGFNDRARAFGDGSGMRIVNPASDGEYIVGRIDGIDLASARALVDRARASEASGWFGKLYGSTFNSTGGVAWWRNYANNASLYGDDQTNWRYELGLFGESRPECSDYQSPTHYFAYSESDGRGKSPSYCLAQFNKGVPNETIPGVAGARQPKPVDALLYFGSLDGFTVAGGFPTLLNWRKNDSCQVTLCANAADPAACRNTSSDPYREINTDCVGVASGFLGYNFQSFPVSIFAIWPTGWGPYSVDQNDAPVVLDDSGVGDTNSAWFFAADEVVSPTCYSYVGGVFGAATQTCAGGRKIGLMQDIATTSVDANNPPTYRLKFYLKTQALPVATSVNAYLAFSYPKAAGVACPTGLSGATTDTSCTYYNGFGTSVAAGSSEWTLVQRDITPPVNSGFNYTRINVSIFGAIAGGRLGIDMVSLQSLSDGSELIVNGAFNDGHRQAANGDYAANFLSRLGGTAFWGSLSHHESAGHSFDVTSLGTLIYFMRGLPLGDAVWLGESHNSGVFYGDPLYSPIAIRLTYPATNVWKFVRGVLPLSGSAVNGRDPTQIATTYRIDYCSGADFYLCGGSTNPWLSTSIQGAGGRENMSFGNFDTSGLAPGRYLLRLGVTSANTARGKNQTFYDYAPIIVYNDTSDIDGDGIPDAVEIAATYGTDPLKADTDGDGLSDGVEVNQYHTDPLKTDTDGDGITDSDEIKVYGTDPLKADTDGDGYNDWSEISAGGNPLDPASIPLAIISTPIASADASLSYTYQLRSTWSGVTYKLIFGPTGMTVDATTGAVTWTPSDSDIGQSRFVIFQASAGGYSQWQSFVITVVAGNTGDVNDDGVVDFADVLLAKRMALGLIVPTPRQQVRADVYRDGVIDLSDILILERRALGL